MTPKSTKELAERVHRVYCKYHKDIRGSEYWTKGDYSLLDEKTKESDRYMVRFIERLILQARIEELKSAMTSGGFGRIRRLEELDKQIKSMKE